MVDPQAFCQQFVLQQRPEHHGPGAQDRLQPLLYHEGGGLFSLMNTTEPAPAVRIASIVAGLNATLSTFMADGREVIMLPLSAFTITTRGDGGRQYANRT